MSRRVKDGLLLVVPAKIYGKTVKVLIDSGATGVLLLHPALLQLD